MTPLAAPLLRIARRVPRPLRGMALMTFAAFLSMAMAAIVKDLVHQLPPFEIVFFRQLFGTLLLGPILLKSGWGAFRTQRLGMHTVRAAFNLVAILAYFLSLGLIPFAEVTALGFTSPLFASLLAVLILGEAVRLPRVIGLLLGLTGSLIILRPGIVDVSVGSLYAVGAAASWAAAMTCIKSLARTDSSVAIAFFASFLQLPMALIIAAFVWEWPTLEQLGLLFVISVIGTTAQVSLSQAFRDADSTVILPMDFTKLVWASLFGFVLFAEIPDPWVWVGGAVVFSGVLWVAYSESRRRSLDRG
jgi:drug/metabolite transporter (DMT)-like permease